jgi:PAS domain S-box-containing protein
MSETLPNPLEEHPAEPVRRLAENVAARYGVALVVTALAVVVRMALAPMLGAKLPYVTLFAAAAISAAFGGFGPGMLSIVAGAAAAVRFFFPPFDQTGPDDSIGLGLFLALGLAIVYAMAAQLRARAGAAEATRRAEHSEARARGILESISDSFYALDTEWRFTYVNQQATRYFGRPKEELLGRSFWDVMPEKVGTVFERSFTMALQRGEPVQFEALSPVTRRWIDVHAYPAEAGLSVFFRDIAERIALQLGGERLAAILSSANDAIITIDESERITLFSAGAEQIFGCPASDAIGQPIDRFIPARFRTHHHAHIRKFGQTGVSVRRMGGERLLVALRANGEEFPMEARISQSSVAGEKLYTVILRDITERVRAEREREELLAQARAAAEDAERANRTKDEFLATVSHELRTPLTPILAWTALLRMRTLDATTLEKGVATIERAARAQTRLVEDLLDVSRIIAGKVRLEVRPIELASAVEPAIESLQPAADAKVIRLHTTLDPSAGVVAGDHERLQQVVWNLLSNAIKFTPKGGRVHVILRRVDSHVELIVHDTGSGIDADFLPHVFERFRQHDSTTTRTHGGLGIGLAIVHHIVELHGGTVHCESAGPGTGATFTVVLPLSPLHAEPPITGHLTGEPSSSRSERPTTPATTSPSIPTHPPVTPLDGMRVLVVDDELDTLDVLATVLREAGAEVRGERTAAAALDLVRTWTPDVLVSDIGMPEQDGYALIRQVRALAPEHGGRTPAVALTAYSRVDDQLQALAAGFQMHVAKPIDPRELIALVATAAGITLEA